MLGLNCIPNQRAKQMNAANNTINPNKKETTKVVSF